LTHLWHSLLWVCSDVVPRMLTHQDCQSYYYPSVWPSLWFITWLTCWRIINALLIQNFRIWPEVFCILFSQYRHPMCHLGLLVNNCHSGTQHAGWRIIEVLLTFIFKMGKGAWVLLSQIQSRLKYRKWAMTYCSQWVAINCRLSGCNHSYKTPNTWTSDLNQLVNPHLGNTCGLTSTGLVVAG